MALRIILLGPPGAGKGTQSEKICSDYHLLHISTGIILREAVQSGSALGKTVAEYLNQGKLVPDAQITAVIKERLKSLDPAKGYLLDGYPRTIEQAKALSNIGEELKTPLTHAIELVVPEEIVIERIKGRAAAPGQFRSDDNDVVARQRLEVYRAQTVPVSVFYRQQGILVEVDGVGSVDQVFMKIKEIIQGPRG
jgi:adenylate kinase